MVGSIGGGPGKIVTGVFHCYKQLIRVPLNQIMKKQIEKINQLKNKIPENTRNQSLKEESRSSDVDSKLLKITNGEAKYHISETLLDSINDQIETKSNMRDKLNHVFKKVEQQNTKFKDATIQAFNNLKQEFSIRRDPNQKNWGSYNGRL